MLTMSDDGITEEKGEVAIEAGQQLLHYRLIGKIGEGASAPEQASKHVPIRVQAQIRQRER